METTDSKLILWLQQTGLSEGAATLMTRIGAILSILLVAFVIDRISRKILIPAIRRITERTESKWDDYLLGDDVLNDFCRFITPVAVYALIPFAIPEGEVLDLVLKLCQVYITVTLRN